MIYHGFRVHGIYVNSSIVDEQSLVKTSLPHVGVDSFQFNPNKLIRGLKFLFLELESFRIIKFYNIEQLTTIFTFPMEEFM